MEGLTEDEETMISKLPQTPSWSPSKPCYNYQGIWYPQHLIKGIILFQKYFKPQPNDIFLCTTPKCGTTWLRVLSFAILTRTWYTNSHDSPLSFKSPQELVPNIESCLASGKTRDPHVPLIQTHVPFSSLPESVLNSNHKIVYICRDPKDVLISYYFFFSMQLDVLSLEDAYEMFCDGVSYFGPYWDHVLGYWKASLEYPERLLFLKYETLKSNTHFHVKKIADFMGYGFSVDEENNGTVEKIVQLCSFENLRSTNANKSTQNHDIRLFSNASFFRKGETGDWKNYLTPQMAERIDQITYEKFNAHGLNL